MIILRHELGDVLRARRLRQGRTLRDVADAAAVSFGYLSEIERGEKEASSELLASICVALELPLSGVLDEVARRIESLETMGQPVELPVRESRTMIRASAA